MNQLKDVDRAYAIGVLGVTGFTGERIALYLAKQQASGQLKCSILLAGRNESKLSKVRTKIEDLARINQSASDVANIRLGTMSDVHINDRKSLFKFTSRVSICISAAGPYRLLGQPVLEACLKSNTHYIDVSGEPEFIEKMILNYDEDAKMRRLTMIHACGFDSIPSDVGCLYSIQKFKDKFGIDSCPTNIEAFITVDAKHGLTGNTGTWNSLIHSMAHRESLAKIRRQLKAKYHSEGGDKVQRVGKPVKPQFMCFDGRVNRYAMLFPGADAAIVRNTQVQLSVRGYRDVQPYYSISFTVPSFVYVIMFMLFGMMLSVMTKFSVTRQLMIRFPRVFSCGTFSPSGPTQKQLDNTSIKLDFFTSGYQRTPSSNNQPTPDAQLHTVCTMPEPGYVATPILAVTTALILLDDLKLPSRKMPVGILTPGTALKSTDVVNRLNASGVHFDVIES